MCTEYKCANVLCVFVCCEQNAVWPRSIVYRFAWIIECEAFSVNCVFCIFISMFAVFGMLHIVFSCLESLFQKYFDWCMNIMFRKLFSLPVGSPIFLFPCPAVDCVLQSRRISCINQHIRLQPIFVHPSISPLLLLLCFIFLLPLFVRC